MPHYNHITPLLGELRWSQTPSDTLLEIQLGWIDFLKSELLDMIVEIRQGYTALSIQWKSVESQSYFKDNFKKFAVRKRHLSQRIWEIPVCYEPDFGKDLRALALLHRMTTYQLIDLHSSQTYRIHFCGFLPGFMYLNGLPDQLHTPRKSAPDRTIEAGSVAIGGAQTGIYPMESPGGWHVIGKCPIRMFDPNTTPPVWAEPGDRIQFEQIDSATMRMMLQNPPLPKSR
jgi:KipI family sensor histidine kinase inhibitor